MSFPPETVQWAQGIKKKLSESITLDKTTPSLEAMIASPMMKDPSFSSKASAIVLAAVQSQNPSKSKKELAETLYNNLQFGYGFKEALETDNWTPWPDECTKANCYGQSIANYAITQLCNLNPTLLEFVGFQKEGDSERAGHSFVLVDVGEQDSPEHWIIDQPMRMYGPISIEGNSITVENLAAKKGRTHRKDFKIKKFEFLSGIINEEEDIVSNVETLRENPEAVLYPGQRVEILLGDRWQSEEPLESPWFLKFIPSKSKKEKGDLVSRIMLNRPGIKSRGLEYRITLGNNGVMRERVIGNYCTGMVWAKFTDAVPLVNLSPETIRPLLEGLEEIPLKERARFEIEMMQQSSSPSNEPRAYLAAAKESFDTVMESEFAEVISAISTVEAIYQHEKGNRETYLTSARRSREITRLKTTHPLLATFAADTKNVRRASRRSKRGQRLRLLRVDQLENPRIQDYLALETEQEMLEHVLSYRPTFVADAIDRVIFYEREIKGKESRIQEIAEDKFGTNYESKIFRGYVKIFAEFLGHFAVTFPELSLQEYKEKIIKKII